MTTLLEYIQAKDLTLDQFGELIGRSGATVSRIARGIHKPDWSTMEAILQATSGEVDPNSFSERAAEAGDDAQAFGGNKPRLVVSATTSEAAGATNPADTASELDDDAPDQTVSDVAIFGR